MCRGISASHKMTGSSPRQLVNCGELPFCCGEPPFFLPKENKEGNISNPVFGHMSKPFRSRKMVNSFHVWHDSVTVRTSTIDKSKFLPQKLCGCQKALQPGRCSVLMPRGPTTWTASQRSLQCRGRNRGLTCVFFGWRRSEWYFYLASCGPMARHVIFVLHLLH